MEKNWRVFLERAKDEKVCRVEGLVGDDFGKDYPQSTSTFFEDAESPLIRTVDKVERHI